MRTTKLITISVFAEFLEKVDQVAKEENRTRSELWREAMRRYIAARELRRLQQYGTKKAQVLGLKEEDVPRLIEESRADSSNA